MKHKAMEVLFGCLLATLAAGCMPAPDSEDLIAQGVKEYNTGRLDRSEITLKKALTLESHNPEALYYLARIYHARKDYPNAIFYYQSTIDRQPNYPGARLMLEMAQKEAGSVGPMLRIIPDEPHD
jgi:tetratricopeptide (TPR) repeat protein